jgi:hypothetical protein
MSDEQFEILNNNLEKIISRINSLEVKFDRSWNMTRPVLEKIQGED